MTTTLNKSRDIVDHKRSKDKHYISKWHHFNFMSVRLLSTLICIALKEVSYKNYNFWSAFLNVTFFPKIFHHVIRYKDTNVHLKAHFWYIWVMLRGKKVEKKFQ